MRLVCSWIALGLGLLLAPASHAQDETAGDVGTKECRDLQIAVEASLPRAQPRNHGEVMSLVNHVLNPFLQVGAITPACSFCIRGPIARRQPSDPCGPDRICGDGERDPAEECDDGNASDGDGCTSDCLVEDCDLRSQCPSGEFCEFPDGTCGFGGGRGVCLEVPATCFCSNIGDPVCGCDGVTYSNDCQRRCAGTPLGYEGECRPEVCGRGTCPVGLVCCNPLLGFCTRPDEPCPQ